MGDLLSQLGRETLPEVVVQEFIRWCIWQQARQSLVLVLEEAQLNDIAAGIQSARDFSEVKTLSEQAKAHIEQLDRENQRSLSAAEGATFEFVNMVRAADDATLDSEAVSFFASRVCGWAGWAVTGFSDTGNKAEAEAAALQAQEAQLSTIWRDYQTANPPPQGKSDTKSET